MTRLVIDASALLSGIASNSEKPPGMLLAALYRGEFEPVVCPILLGEVRHGLHSGYFRNHVAEHDIERVVLTLARASVQLRDQRTRRPWFATPPTTTSSRSRSPHAREASSPATRTCSIIPASTLPR